MENIKLQRVIAYLPAFSFTLAYIAIQYGISGAMITVSPLNCSSFQMMPIKQAADYRVNGWFIFFHCLDSLYSISGIWIQANRCVAAIFGIYL